MTATVTLREHARLTVDALATPTLDRAQVSHSAFDWLCRLSAGLGAGGARLVEVENRRWLRMDNYVGIIETPCGTRIEILPKHVEGAESEAPSRRLLRRMISAALDLPARDVGLADLERFDAPVSEWVIGRFLEELDRLVQRGVRFDYVRVESEERFLRGQLDTVRQIRQGPGRDHLFRLRQDVFVADRAENRLLRLAIDQVAKATRDPAHWRRAQELRHLFQEVPASAAVSDDFERWQDGRLMAHYQAVRPWCEMVLHRQMPLAVAGTWRGISMLFPMERLFERYVARWLHGALHTGAELTTQAASRFLCQHDGSAIFQLKPDLLVANAGQRWLLDTKWKLLTGQRTDKYGLSQGDFYQLFAYAHRYVGGLGDMYLIFPKTAAFSACLPTFDFGSGLRLHVVPFDLDACRLEIGTAGDLPIRAESEKPR